MSSKQNKLARAFPESRIFFTALGNGSNRVRAQIQVGKGTPNQYYISGEAQGQQIFRTQYDLAVDGTEYVLAAGAGQGSYTFNVFEGPFDCINTPKNMQKAARQTPFAASYQNLRKFENRIITVIIPLDGTINAVNTGNNGNTSLRAQFSGMVTAATTRQFIEGSQYYVVTSVQTMGVWR